MASAIESIHEQARDDDEAVTAVLTRAVYLATVLRQKRIAEWLKHELRGYEAEDELPHYRRDVRGLLLAWMPGKDWIEAPVLDSIHEEVARTEIRDSAHDVEQTYLRTRRHGNHRVELSEAHQQVLKEKTNLDARLNLALPSQELAQILQTLRITVELWTADLIEAGLESEGMAFSAADREAATPLAERLDDYLARAAEQARPRAAAMSAAAGTGGGFLRRLFGHR